jgi:diguanylate cyclase (GGDEF)-like protein
MEAHNLSDVLYDLRHELGVIKDAVLVKTELAGIDYGTRQTLADIFSDEISNKIISREEEDLTEDERRVAFLGTNYLSAASVRILGHLESIERSEGYNSLEDAIVKDHAAHQIGLLRQAAIDIPRDTTLRKLFAGSTAAFKLSDEKDLRRYFVKEGLIDPKTKLHSKSGFEAIGGDRIARYIDHPDQPVTVVAIDVKGFKEYNDRNGHEQADLALKAVGQCMTETLEALKARADGDEYWMLLEGPDARGAEDYITNRLFPHLTEKLDEYVKREAAREGVPYRNVLEHPLVLRVGISSTNLPGSDKSFFHRLYDWLPDIEENADVRYALELGEAALEKKNDYSRAVRTMLRSLDHSGRDKLRSRAQDLLKYEAESAMHRAQELGKGELDTHLTFIYDPGLSSVSYEYHSSRGVVHSER